MNLLSTELRRFFARRAILGGILFALLLALVVNVVQTARSKDDSARVRTSVPQIVVDSCTIGTFNGLPVVDTRTCGVVRFGPEGLSPTTSSVTDYRDAYTQEGDDTRLRIAATYSDTVQGVGVALTLLVAILAATFIAADFGTSLATQLLFEPRRHKVYVTKTLAVAIGCFITAVMVLVWCGMLQYFGSAWRGSTAGVDASWLLHRAGDVGRASGACAMMAVVAFAIGVMTRRTAGAVGVLFGLLVAQGFLHARPWTRAIGRIVPVNAIWAVTTADFSDREAFLGIHTLAGATLIAVAWVIGVTVLGTMWFSRREIR